VGKEQCRKVNVHGRAFFSIEQQALCCVVPTRDHSWVAVIMADTGSPSEKAPWRKPTQREGQHLQIFPMTRYGHCAFKTIDLPGPRVDARDTRDFTTADPFVSRAQNDSLLLNDAERALAEQDPFVLAIDLIDTFVLSWLRLFSFLRHFHENSPSDEEKALSLQSDKMLVDRGRRYIREAICFVESRHSRLGWPASQQMTDDARALMEAMATQAKADLVELLREADTVSSDIGQILQAEVNMMSIRESRKSLDQQDRVRGVTWLAFIFLPASLMAGCFGMNLDVFEDPKPGVKHFLWSVIPFTLVSILLPFAFNHVSKMVKEHLSKVKADKDGKG
jgi:hypothetical protein